MFTFLNNWQKIKHYLRNNLNNLKVEVNYQYNTSTFKYLFLAVKWVSK